MKRKKILFRVEGNREIGLGHIMRNIALAQAFTTENYQLLFLLSDHSRISVEQVTSAGFSVQTYSLHESPGGIYDALFTADTYFQKGFDFLILDGYFFKEGYQQYLRSKNIRFMVFDDYNYCKEFSADILLNQNLSASRSLYKANEELKLILGSKYTILRDEFLSTKSSVRKKPDSGKINLLITLGGSDKRNITYLVLSALTSIKVDYLIEVTIVLGKANTHLQSLKTQIEELPDNYSVLIVQDVKNMATFMANADACICAGGSTVYEVLFFELPSLVLCIADNQYQSCFWLENNKKAIIAGVDKKLSIREMKQKIRELLRAVGNNEEFQLKDLIDGKGKFRVVEEIAKFI